MIKCSGELQAGC